MSHDEAARVAFWIESMERSYALAEAIMRHPLAECGERFASIPEAAVDARVEMLFSTTGSPAGSSASSPSAPAWSPT